jgi:hypothetical protein
MEITEETPLEEEETQVIEGEEGSTLPDDDNEEEPLSEDEETEELQIIFGDEKAPEEKEEEEPAPKWVKDLRKRHTELKKENRKLREKIQQAEQPKPQETGLPPDPGPLPTIESCDYDQEKFNTLINQWQEKKTKRELAVARADQERQQANAQWQQRLNRYQEMKADLKVSDFDTAEEDVKDTLNVTQQGLIIHGADNPALVVYALGRNPKKAKELSQIQDPIKFAFAVAKIEAQMKVTNRKPSAKPEKRITSTGPTSGTVDSQLKRLRAEAERTGDYSKVNAYKREKRRSAK